MGKPTLQVMLFGTAALIACWITLERVPDFILLNRTPSMPIGLYVRTSDPIELGSIVTVEVHEVAHAYALEREVGPDFRLLKRVAATSGNIVCADGYQILIDGEVRAVRSARDSVGRPLRSWTGCVVLSAARCFAGLHRKCGVIDEIERTGSVEAHR